MVAALPRKVADRREQTGSASLDRAQLLAQQTAKAHEQTKGAVNVLSNYVFTDLSVDVTTASATFTDLLIIPAFQTFLATGFILVTFHVSFAMLTNPGNANFQIVVDGTIIRAGHTAVAANQAGFGNLLVRAPVRAGKHVVKVQWSSSVATLRVAPKTNPEFASLLVQEIAA